LSDTSFIKSYFFLLAFLLIGSGSTSPINFNFFLLARAFSAASLVSKYLTPINSSGMFVTSANLAPVFPKFILNFAFSGMLNNDLPVDLSTAFLSTSLMSLIFILSLAASDTPSSRYIRVSSLYL
jgi:hypothetical protein